MSFKNFALTVLCVLIFSTNSQAAVQFTFSPELGVMGGTTEYELDVIFNDTTNSGIGVKRRITSLLEFPLDVTIGGISGEIHPMEDQTRWSIGLKFLTNLNNPSEKMIDTDWDEMKTIFPYTKWSETNSNAEIDLTILDAEFRFRIVQKKSMDISILAGGRYQRIYQEAIGLDGWQRKFNVDSNLYDPSFDFSYFQDTVVGTYEIKLKQFKVGIQSEIYLSSLFTSQLKIAFAPVFFDDKDDHVLRNKLSTASGDGKGIITGFNLRYHNSYGILSYVQLNATYNYLTANSSQTQWWYDDEVHTDPNSQEVIIDIEKNTIISGIPHTIRSTQYGVSVQFGFEL